MKILNEQLDKITPSEQELDHLKKQAQIFTEQLDKELSKARFDADVFIGGSFAKGTLVKSSRYDIDVFVRFSWKYSELGKLLEGPLKKTASALKMKYERIHGSRDYFRVFPDKNLVFEIIPVTRINKAKEERNVTDLSYFHVGYVKRAAKKLQGQIRLAKTFCKAQGVYGAESYINGFSGYGLECLIIYYKSFEKMLKQLSKTQDRVVIDIKKYYKNKQDIVLSVNEAKIQGPIILIDPTYKERNVLAALNHDSFVKFQDAARRFLKKPSKEFFEPKFTDRDKLANLARQKKAQLLVLELATNRQEGDIAGTKMKKFALYLKRELSKNAEITAFEFDYYTGQNAQISIVARSHKDIVRIGPPIYMEGHVKEFKKQHKKTFVKNGFIHANIKISENLKDLVSEILKDKDKLKSMAIVDTSIKDS